MSRRVGVGAARGEGRGGEPRLGKLRRRRGWRGGVGGGARVAAVRASPPGPLAQLHRRGRGETHRGGRGSGRRGAFGATVGRGRVARRAPPRSQRVRVRRRGGVGRRGGDVRRVRAPRNFGRGDERRGARGGGGVGARNARRNGRAGAPRVAIGGKPRRRGGRESVGSRVRDGGFEPTAPDARDAHSGFRATGSGGRGGGGVGDVATPRAVSPRRAVGPLRQRHRRVRRRASRHRRRDRRLRRRGARRRRYSTRRKHGRGRGRYHR